MTDAYLDDLLDELVPTEPHEAWNDVLRRARRARRRYVVVVAAVLTLLVAPSAWAIQHAVSTKHYVPTYAPRAEQLVDLSWLSARDGWALLGRSCGRDHRRCAVAEETRDGGARWRHLGLLPAEIGSSSIGAFETGGDLSCAARHPCVTHLLFTSRSVGYAYGPSLFMTLDGGRSWTRVPADPIESMVSSGSKLFRIVYAHTGCPGPCNPELQGSIPGSRTWTRLTAPVAPDGAGTSLYAAGSNVYVFSWRNIAGGLSSHADIAVSRNGGRTWSSIEDPCGSDSRTEFDAANASAAGNLLGVLCVPKGGGRPIVALSRDAGRTFVRGGTVPGGRGQIAISRSGVIAIGNAGVTGTGPYSYVLSLSRDEGHTWREVVRYRQKVALDLAGGFLQFVSNRDAFWVGYPYALWRSVDGGRAWHMTRIGRR